MALLRVLGTPWGLGSGHLAVGTLALWDFGTCRFGRCPGLGLGHVDDDPPIVRCTFRSGCCQQVGLLDD